MSAAAQSGDDKTRYECQECGHTVRSSAQYPQCSNRECRSRNLEEIGSPEPEGTDEPEPDDEPEETDDSDGDDWEPLFETETVETDAEPGFDNSDLPGKDDAEKVADAADGDLQIEAEHLEAVIATPFDVVARRKGEHWELSDQEAERLADAYADLLNKYIPEAGDHMVEVTAIIVTITVVAPRLMQDTREESEEPDSDLPTKEDLADEEPDEQPDEQPAGTTAFDRV